MPATPNDDAEFFAAVENLNSEPLRKGPPCSVGTMLDALPADRAAAIRSLIDNPELYGSKVAEFLAKHGGARPAKASAILRHRKRHAGGGCGCEA